jgi:hypothetical protein
MRNGRERWCPLFCLGVEGAGAQLSLTLSPLYVKKRQKKIKTFDLVINKYKKKIINDMERTNVLIEGAFHLQMNMLAERYQFSSFGASVVCD